MFTLFNVHYSVLPMFICQALALNPSFSVCKSFPASLLDARPGFSIIFSTPSSSSSSTNRPRLCITQPLSTSFSSFHPESSFPTHPLRFNWNANPTLCCTSKDPFSQRKYRRHTVLSINIVATKQVQGRNFKWICVLFDFWPLDSAHTSYGRTWGLVSCCCDCSKFRDRSSRSRWALSSNGLH